MPCQLSAFLLPLNWRLIYFHFVESILFNVELGIPILVAPLSISAQAQSIFHHDVEAETAIVCLNFRQKSWLSFGAVPLILKK